MTTNVQSVITVPATPKANGAAKAKANGSTALTPAQAVTIAFEYGQTMAGQDGALTNAFKTFADSEKVIADMVQALTEGYFVRKLKYSRDEAKRVIALAKYNQLHPTKNTTANRTKEQETVMSTVRVLVSRAKAMAGLTTPAAKPAAKPADKPADKAAKPAANGGTAHPDGNAIDNADDVNVVMMRFAQTIQAYYKKHAADFNDDAGMAWRDWIAAAPRIIIAK